MINDQGQAIFAADDDSVDALEFYKSLEGNSGTWDEDFKNDAASFLERKAAMITATSWRYRDILFYNDAYDLNLDIGVSQIPQLQGQDQPIINWADYWGNMVALNRPNSSAAWTFLKWVTEPEQLEKLNENISNESDYFGMLYPRKDMNQLLQNDEYLKVFNESLPYAQTWYMIKGIEVKNLFKDLLNSSSTSQSQLVGTQSNVDILLESQGQL
jgi:ABC-type glycerol-3-phosphate transport system substrate-binding protein